jgi:hypothetical protein
MILTMLAYVFAIVAIFWIIFVPSSVATPDAALQ